MKKSGSSSIFLRKMAHFLLLRARPHTIGALNELSSAKLLCAHAQKGENVVSDSNPRRQIVRFGHRDARKRSISRTFWREIVFFCALSVPNPEIWPYLALSFYFSPWENGPNDWRGAGVLQASTRLLRCMRNRGALMRDFPRQFGPYSDMAIKKKSGNEIKSQRQIWTQNHSLFPFFRIQMRKGP